MTVNKLKQIWPEWEAERLIGEGAFGKVYKCVRNDNGLTSYAAIKIISIPQSQSEVDSLRAEGLDIDASRTFFKDIVDDFVNEIKLMESFKGMQNIVSVEDYKVVEKENEVGWDIFIRMELLTPFNTYISEHKLTEEDVIKIGCDVCSALEICSQKKIIHRDIKPENIFVNDFGSFKLGDFGIARSIENATGGFSQKGTYNYMAPEVANGSQYDSRVDIYSLGILLYRLMNENRLPLIHSEKQLISPNDRKEAVERRLKGESLPPPCNASSNMANLILRACAYNPANRFASASEMRMALEGVKNNTYTIVPVEDNKTVSVRKAPQAAKFNATETVAPVTFGKKKSKLPAVIVMVLICTIVVVGAIFAVPAMLNNIQTSGYADTSSEEESTASYSKADQAHIDDIIADAKEFADEGYYDDAIAKVEKGLELFSDSADLQQKIEEYQLARDEKIKKDTLEEAASLASSGDNLAAMLRIKNSKDSALEDIELRKAYDSYCEVYKTNVMADADVLAKEGDYLGAVKAVNEAIGQIGEDATLTAVAKSYEDTYISNVIAEADKLVEQYDYDEAISLLRTAKGNVKNVGRVDTKINEISSKKPVVKNVNELIKIDSDAYEIYDDPMTDTHGNTFDFAGGFDFYDGFVTYYTEGKYTNLCGFIAPEEDLSGSNKATIYIYADDVLVYTSPEITRMSKPVAINIDITGADTITVKGTLDARSLILCNEVFIVKLDVATGPIKIPELKSSN